MAQQLQAQELTRAIKIAYKASEISKLLTSAQFGDVFIEPLIDDSIRINVNITAYNKNEKQAQQMLDQVKIVVEKTQGALNVTTANLPKSTGGKRGGLSVDYNIKIPMNLALDIKNRFGDVKLADYQGQGNFDVNYGNLNCDDITSASGTTVNVKFGNCNIQSVTNLNGRFEYGDIKIEKCGTLNIVSKFSDVELGDIGSLTHNSGYDDVEVNSIKSATIDSRFSDYSIGKAQGDLRLDGNYGSVVIDGISSGCKNVNLNCKFGSATINMSGFSYDIDASTKFGGLRLSDIDASFSSKIKDENNEKSIRTTIGNNTDNRKLYIRSGYTDVRIKNK